MRRKREAELHFYEWRAAVWAMSETRDRLNAAGRGIYRELLDQCYLQGHFPYDTEWVCRRCACTPEEFEKAWKIISRHFPEERPDYRCNTLANIVRKEYFQYVERQRKNRVGNHNAFNDLHNGGSTVVEPPLIICETVVDPPIDGGATVVRPNGNGNGNGNIKPPIVPLSRGTKKRPAKRPIAEVEKALGERLPWWKEFWKVYPSQGGKRDAIDAFERTVVTHEMAAKIWKKAKAYAIECSKKPDHTPKYAQGWLNGERWEDGPSLVALETYTPLFDDSPIDREDTE